MFKFAAGVRSFLSSTCDHLTFSSPLFLHDSLISSHMRPNSGSSSEANMAWAVSFKLLARCLITLSERGGDGKTGHKDMKLMLLVFVF